GIITIDATGTILEFNPAAEHIFGYTQAEAIGQPMAELLIPDKMRQKHLDGFAKCCETGISDMLNRRIETWGKRKDGSEFPAELALARIENHHHCVFTAFVRDITERKKHEDDVKEAARRKDEFLAVLAHELRNPLSPIRNGVRILKVLVGAKGSK